ncbi:MULTISPECIES: DUF4352 domain-containing protein [unclassified Paenibacillus]|uniref:DUF4352 domain-containing protein n=1 Tax=unclassified Paenibacillus TaxID=185978 RepID=UPI001E42B2AD|nr:MULTISPECIES: DUF4352 domain-containing protein [unclassified Paenibacillus]CAH0120380.1 hypothetical protein PAE9249_02899 [Paenibacillus sp. CECT 9249]
MKKKAFIIASLACFAAVAFSAGVFAAQDIKLIVNGKTAKADVKTIDGSTYVPLRAVSEMLGAKVDYDPKTKTVTITGAAGAGEKENANEKAGTSLRNAAPIGTTVSFSDSGIYEYEGTLTVNEVIRGEEAWKLVSQNEFNKEPKEGYEYLLAKVTFGVTKNKKNADEQIVINPARFDLLSGDGKVYDRTSVADPEPGIASKLYAGASHTGWVGFHVKKDDPNPIIAYARSLDGTGGAWLRTSK